MAITAHCIIKNEENFVSYAIRSVINFVDLILVYDTGSNDRTALIVADLLNRYPGKIIFEEKGPCDKKRHTELRQEMVERTITDWFMILDGDEIWTKRALVEAKSVMSSGHATAIESYFYECVGDLFHCHYKKSYKTARFIKNQSLVWKGEYSADNLYFRESGKPVSVDETTFVLKNKFWHATHLARSSAGNSEYSSGGTRKHKFTPTYFLIGRAITEPAPEVCERDFGMLKLSPLKSFMNFFPFALKKLFA